GNDKVKPKVIGKNTISKIPKKTIIVQAEKKMTAVQTEIPKEKKLKRFKPNKKERYSISELKHFRNIILLERKAILESAKANMDALVDKDSGEYKGDNLTYSSHMAEQGTDEMEREKNYLFVQRDEKYLGYLQDALMRIDQGTYGICVDCRDNPKNLCRTCPLIVKERLELVPITQHCIECKNLRG
ncbi:MAG: conjugal transfer protein TraR, partial [bacterium]